MSFAKKISEIHEQGDIEDLLSKHIGPELLTQMLKATGKAAIRRRNFPAGRVLPLEPLFGMMAIGDRLRGTRTAKPGRVGLST